MSVPSAGLLALSFAMAGVVAGCSGGIVSKSFKPCEGAACKSTCDASDGCGSADASQILSQVDASVSLPRSDGSTPFGQPVNVTSDASTTCASRTVKARRVTPNVVLIVDQSGSMTESFQGAGTRWAALREFLLEDPGGLIASLQNQIRFGLAMYSGLSEEPEAACPVMTHVSPQLNNFQNISASYSSAEPLDDTPTGDAIDAVVDELGLASSLDQEPDPTVFILATDGAPDRCEELDPQNGQEEAIAAVQRAYSLGVPTFVISVGEGDYEEQHRDMANAGQGLGPMDDQAPFWVAGDDASLRSALTEIVGSQVSCDVALNGRVASGDPCAGTISLSGVALTCNDANGWTLIDDQHIRVQGDACDEFKTDVASTLEVSFPCSVGILE